MINDEVLEAIAAWVGEVIPAIGAKTYTHEPGDKEKGLPDCVVHLATEAMARETPEEFPMFRLQQVGVQVWRCGGSIMVDNGTTEVHAAAAQATLREYARDLLAGVAADPFLGQRLEDHAQASVWSLSFDYNGPLVEYEDGTIGREVTFTLAVAEPVTILD